MQENTIRRALDNDVRECELLLRSLPEWFGIEESIQRYIRDIVRLETLVSIDSDGITGFLTLRHHNRFTSEIEVMAVRREQHRMGIGRSLVTFAQQELVSRAVEYFQVKTLGPSHPDPHYNGTRRFYEKLGFRPLEENKLWGEDNPCLIMVRHLNCTVGGNRGTGA